jgi:cystathionine gamma-synthase/cystathionine gamma-lyase/cystathionine beta-lyase
MSDPASWQQHITKDTRAIYMESISNPLLEVADHRRVAAFAREHKLVSIIDNTFASPVNFRPMELGFDLVVHSATKYLNGHSDLCAGAIVGSRERINQIKGWLDHLGGCADPETCFLLRRGLKTLALRVARQNENALKLAQYLEGHASFRNVRYPGLASHPDHDLARSLFAGFGGMLACELVGDLAATERFTQALKVVTHSASLGGPETLVTLPTRTSHAGLSAHERATSGITDSLMRISTGIEHIDDLLTDFEQAAHV